MVGVSMSDEEMSVRFEDGRVSSFLARGPPDNHRCCVNNHSGSESANNNVSSHNGHHHSGTTSTGTHHKGTSEPNRCGCCGACVEAHLHPRLLLLAALEPREQVFVQGPPATDPTPGVEGPGLHVDLTLMRPKFPWLDGWPWLAYRAAAFALLFSVMAADWDYYVRNNPYNFVWPVYLTNLTLLLQTSLLLAKFLLCLYHHNRPPYAADHDMEDGCVRRRRLRWRYRLLWAGNTCVTTAALTVSAVYWGVLYHPGMPAFNFINLGKHLFNSVIAVADLVLSATPFRLAHFHVPMTYAGLYLMFTWVYWAAGGVDKRGRPHLYEDLTWDVPSRALVFAGKSLAAILAMHAVAWALWVAGDWLSRRPRCGRHGWVRMAAMAGSPGVMRTFENGSRASEEEGVAGGYGAKVRVV